MKKAYLLFVAIVISVCTSAQNGKNLIKPIDKDGFEVDSILSMRGDVIVYLRAGTEFDIKKSDVAYSGGLTLLKWICQYPNQGISAKHTCATSTTKNTYNSKKRLEWSK